MAGFDSFALSHRSLAVAIACRCNSAISAHDVRALLERGRGLAGGPRCVGVSLMTNPCAGRSVAVQDARVKVSARMAGAALIIAVPAKVSKCEGRIGAVLRKATRSARTRRADYAMPCRFF